MGKLRDEERKLIDKEHKAVERLVHVRQSVFSRFPLLFTVLGAFGLVTTFYGFEHLLNQVDLFINNPWLMLATGITTLVFTGTLYKYLQQ